LSASFVRLDFSIPFLLDLQHPGCSVLFFPSHFLLPAICLLYYIPCRKPYLVNDSLFFPLVCFSPCILPHVTLLLVFFPSRFLPYFFSAFKSAAAKAFYGVFFDGFSPLKLVPAHEPCLKTRPPPVLYFEFLPLAFSLLFPILTSVLPFSYLFFPPPCYIVGKNEGDNHHRLSFFFFSTVPRVQ